MGPSWVVPGLKSVKHDDIIPFSWQQGAMVIPIKGRGYIAILFINRTKKHIRCVRSQPSSQPKLIPYNSYHPLKLALHNGYMLAMCHDFYKRYELVMVESWTVHNACNNGCIRMCYSMQFMLSVTGYSYRRLLERQVQHCTTWRKMLQKGTLISRLQTANSKLPVRKKT